MRKTLELFKDFVESESKDNLISTELISDFIKSRFKVKSTKFNCTINFDSKEEIQKFLTWIDDFIEIEDWSLLKDNSELYDNSPTFRKLASAEKKAKRAKADFIHKNS